MGAFGELRLGASESGNWGRGERQLAARRAAIGSLRRAAIGGFGELRLGLRRAAIGGAENCDWDFGELRLGARRAAIGSLRRAAIGGAESGNWRRGELQLRDSAEGCHCVSCNWEASEICNRRRFGDFGGRLPLGGRCLEAAIGRLRWMASESCDEKPFGCWAVSFWWYVRGKLGNFGNKATFRMICGAGIHWKLAVVQ